MNSPPERNGCPGNMGRPIATSGMKRLLGKNGIRVPMGLANSISFSETVYVDSSRMPLPQGGRREPIENSSGPAKLIGPTGPEKDQLRIFFSLSQMVTSARFESGGVFT